MTDSNPILDRIAAASTSIKDSANLMMEVNTAPPSGMSNEAIGGATTRMALLNGLLLQQAALDVAIVNARAQERIAAAAEDQALSLKSLIEELSALASDISIISGQNPGGYSWSPQLSVEIANWGDQR